LFNLPFLAVGAAVGPLISRYHARNALKSVGPAVRRWALATTGLVLAGYAAFVLLGQQLIAVLFGTEFRSTYVILLILGIGIVATAATGYASSALIMTGHTTHVVAVVVPVSLATVALEVICARFGVLGIAAASSAGTCASNLLIMLLAARKLHLWTFAWPAR
jgi:O-antigen/teichoic acid export membrane protein